MDDARAPTAVPRKRRRFVVALVAVVALIALALAAALAWLTSESALRRALEELSSRTGGALSFESPGGSLLSAMHAARVVYRDAHVEVVADDVAIRWSPRRLWSHELYIDDVTAKRVSVSLAPSSEPSKVPDSLGLPFDVTIAHAAIAHLEVRSDDTARALDDVAFAYSGGPTVHRVTGLDVASPWGRFAGEATLAARAPFGLRGAFSLAATDALRGATANVTLGGSLPAVDVKFAARALDASATGGMSVAPFAATPLVAATIDARGIDPAKFDAALPSMRLAAKLEAKADAPGRYVGTIDATNADAGPLDAGRVPLVSLASRFAISRERLDLENVRADLGAAGRASGSGSIDLSSRAKLPPSEWNVAVRELDLSRLYRRAIATKLDGRIRAQRRARTAARRRRSRARRSRPVVRRRNRRRRRHRRALPRACRGRRSGRPREAFARRRTEVRGCGERDALRSVAVHRSAARVARRYRRCERTAWPAVDRARPRDVAADVPLRRSARVGQRTRARIRRADRRRRRRREARRRVGSRARKLRPSGRRACVRRRRAARRGTGADHGLALAVRTRRQLACARQGRRIGRRTGNRSQRPRRAPRIRRAFRRGDRRARDDGRRARVVEGADDPAQRATHRCRALRNGRSHIGRSLFARRICDQRHVGAARRDRERRRQRRRRNGAPGRRLPADVDSRVAGVDRHARRARQSRSVCDAPAGAGAPIARARSRRARRGTHRCRRRRAAHRGAQLARRAHRHARRVRLGSGGGDRAARRSAAADALDARAGRRLERHRSASSRGQRARATRARRPVRRHGRRSRPGRSRSACRRSTSRRRSRTTPSMRSQPCAHRRSAPRTRRCASATLRARAPARSRRTRRSPRRSRRTSRRSRRCSRCSAPAPSSTAASR